MNDCLGGLYRCIVPCVHLHNGTDRRTATIAASLLFTSGLTKLGFIVIIFVLLCVYVNGYMQGTVRIEPDKLEPMLPHGGTSLYMQSELRWTQCGRLMVNTWPVRARHVPAVLASGASSLICGLAPLSCLSLKPGLFTLCWPLAIGRCPYVTYLWYYY